MTLLRKNKQLQQELDKYKRIQQIWDTDEYNKAIKRLPELTLYAILGWADEAGTKMMEAFQEYRRTGNADVLDELRRAVSVLQAVTEDLMIRNGK